MNIGVIGIGVLGKAYVKGFKKWGHKIVQYDIKGNFSFNKLLDTEICFVCVPSPSMGNGKCDTRIVESVLRKLNNEKFKGLICIASTVDIGFTSKSISKYKKLKICGVPELLKERSSAKDFLNNKIIVVGTNDKKKFLKVKKCFKNKTFHMVNPDEAEIFKYFNNCYAALRVVFANIFYEISMRKNCNYKKIKDIYIKTGKAIDMYLDVNKNLRGYAGMCLPKDVRAIKYYMTKKKINFNLINQIDLDNGKLKKTVFRGMRK
tara:strand:- start:3798 stop:4583 length:786 start_codon:yes stop_codon:yes gene_type:complete